MGYCVSSYNNKFFIKKENIEKAFKALMNFAENNKDKFHKYKWVDVEDILNAEDFTECMDNLGWETEQDKLGNIDNIGFMREKLGEDYRWFEIIAPYVKKGSYIEMYGEDGDKWRWIFNGVKCKEIYPEIVWEEDF